MQTTSDSHSVIHKLQVTAHKSLRHRRTYMLARYYTSGSGRFLQVDPGYDYDRFDPMSFNLYGYVRGNPVVGVDPTGLTLYAFSDGSTFNDDSDVDEVVYVDENDAGTTLTNTDGTTMSQEDFGDYVATVYAESSNGTDQREFSGIASAITNFMDCKETTLNSALHDPTHSINGTKGDGHDAAAGFVKDNSTPEWAKAKMARSVKGALNALSGGTDYSQGAVFWEGMNNLVPGTRTYETQRAHNNMYIVNGAVAYPGTSTGVIRFEAVAAYGGTVFMHPDPSFNNGQSVWSLILWKDVK